MFIQLALTDSDDTAIEFAEDALDVRQKPVERERLLRE